MSYNNNIIWYLFIIWSTVGSNAVGIFVQKFCWKCTRLLPIATAPCLWGKEGEKKHEWTWVKKISHYNCLEHYLSTKYLRICCKFLPEVLRNWKSGRLPWNLKGVVLTDEDTGQLSYLSVSFVMCYFLICRSHCYTLFQFWRLLSSHFKCEDRSLQNIKNWCSESMRDGSNQVVGKSEDFILRSQKIESSRS